MIVHIVFLKFKNDEDKKNVKSLLEKLPAKIPCIRDYEIGIDENRGERACDLRLYSTFDSKEDLKAYAVHEEHVKVLEVIKKTTEYTKVVDYEK